MHPWESEMCPKKREPYRRSMYYFVVQAHTNLIKNMAHYRLLFFRYNPLFNFLFLFLVMNFHTWWHCHPISVSQVQLSSHNSVISCLCITDRWLLSCASETKIRWQRHQVWKFTNNVCKSKILLKKCSLGPYFLRLVSIWPYFLMLVCGMWG